MRLRFIESEKSRHGRDVVYFRRGRGLRIRLPPVEAKDFRMHYDAAFAGKPLPYVREMPVTMTMLRRQRVERAMREAIKGAASRSRRRRLPFNLTIDWLLARADRQEFRCALTGIEFFAAHASQGKTNPFVPSLDRIDPKGGYTTENVRIVILAVNLMLLDWGPEIFEQVANSFRYWKKHKTRKSIPLPSKTRPAPLQRNQQNQSVRT